MTPNGITVRHAAELCAPVHAMQLAGSDRWIAVFTDGRRVAVGAPEVEACRDIAALVDLIDTRRTFARRYAL